ncbi:MAG TPA: RDD family protein [Opitutaceae bacterium]|jgi:uncharacterized RDD family membrane protein YckC|nr:RDD family protein [Opitutaceae bacterium]
MNTPTPALRMARLFAALLPLSAALLAADPTPTPTAAPESPMHEIGANQAPAEPALKAAPPVATAAATTTAATKADSDDNNDDDRPVRTRHSHRGGNDDGNRVAVGDSVAVNPNQSIEGNEVAVFGNLKDEGEVEGNAVAVCGASRIEGSVHGNAVVILGTMRLGPNAHVDGNVVCVGGTIMKDPGAYVGGHIVNLGVLTATGDDNMASSWWSNGIQMGRPIAFGHHLHALWVMNVFLIGLYIVMALAFPVGIAKCTDTLTKRPGATFLVGVVSIIALPFLFILLLVTVVGIPVAVIVLPLGVLTAILFGKAAIYRLVGSSLIGRNGHTALAVLVGAIIATIIYLVPVAGLMLWTVIAFLGFACVMTTLLSPVRTAIAVTTPIAVAVPVAAPSVAPLGADLSATAAAALVVPVAAEGMPMPPPIAAVPPPIAGLPLLVAEAALPRARFWPRMLGIVIDAVLIGILLQRAGDAFLPVIGAYSAVFWKFKGSTVGSIIVGHKVVRIDGRPVDWMTAIVRALACFISLIAVGLGFIWIAFDSEKQGWHDKIAGTVVVKLPKGASLV